MRAHRSPTDSKLFRPAARLVVLCVAGSLVTAACTKAPDVADGPAPGRDGGSGGPSRTIEQPAVTGLQVAPSARRVDVDWPAFSRPQAVSNPLFPVAQQASVLLLGQVDGREFRTEVTLLPETRILQWGDQRVETLVSQYVAFLDGRIHEVAYDLYAQDDQGAVWYFGEDVFNFADGAIVDTHGSWQAGRDGPAAMIMPSHPEVGDVYRPENIPGLVFEEVTVKSVDQTLAGPLGPVGGGLVIEELHGDGSTEAKSFAPGYGEFYTDSDGDVEALALAVPRDGAEGPVPPVLTMLQVGGQDTARAARSGQWDQAQTTVGSLRAAWDAQPADQVPQLIAPRMLTALQDLDRGVRDRDVPGTRQAAFDVVQSSLDQQLRFRPVVEIDAARFGLWLDRLSADAEAGDASAVRGDLFTLDYLRDRISHALEGSVREQVNAGMEALQAAVADNDLAAAGGAASELQATVARASTSG